MPHAPLASSHSTSTTVTRAPASGYAPASVRIGTRSPRATPNGRPSGPLRSAPVTESPHLSTRQNSRIVGSWVRSGL